MCLISLAIDRHPRFALVVASNRDETFDRPAAPLGWWQPTPEAAPVLGGRDLHAGGSWMALSLGARLALLTNVRDLSRLRTAAPSRGAIVADWLSSDAPAAEFWQRTRRLGHNPFNLVMGDFRGRAAGHWWWADDRASQPVELSPGIHGISNASLATPWPKVRHLDAALARALAGSSESAALESMLFDALADRSPVADEDLPDTGIGLERERSLAPAFIRSPDGRYGTRCSNVLVVERVAGGCRLHLVERSFDARGEVCGQRAVRDAPWPLTDPLAAPVRDESLKPS